MNPLISLVTPAYNTSTDWFKQCIESVIQQTYTNWEWCLIDNGSTTSVIMEVIRMYPDVRIKASRIENNIGGAEAINLALENVTGDYVGLLDSDDRLHPVALNTIAECINSRFSHILYTDEMICDDHLNNVIPFYKPSFNYFLLYKLHYFVHLTLYKTDLIKRLRLRQSGGSYDYDLALRAVSVVDTNFIASIPYILYDYRTYGNSTSSLTREACIEGALNSLQEHLNQHLLGATAYRDGSLYKVIDAGGCTVPVYDLQLNSDEPNLLECLLRDKV